MAFFRCDGWTQRCCLKKAKEAVLMLQFLGKINRSPVCASLVCRARRLGSSFKTLWTFSRCMTERTGGKDEEKRNSTSLKNKKTGGKLFSRSLLCWRSLKKTLQIFFSDTLKKKKEKILWWTEIPKVSKTRAASKTEENYSAGVRSVGITLKKGFYVIVWVDGALCVCVCGCWKLLAVWTVCVRVFGNVISISCWARSRESSDRAVMNGITLGPKYTRRRREMTRIFYFLLTTPPVILCETER